MTRKTDDMIILQMLNKGKTQKAIAEHFGVSPAAVCKRIKRLLNKTPKSFENLTKKEQMFALSIASGKTQTQSALDSHECSSLDSAKSIGHQLMQKPDIQMAVSELMQEEGLTRRYRVQKLKTHIDHPDPNVSLKGLDQSWKLDAAYTEKHVHAHMTGSQNYDYIKNLERMLAEVDERIDMINKELEVKETWVADLKELYPEMEDEAILKMAEKAIAIVYPESEETTQSKPKLEADTIKGEVIGDD